jgi:hypothetical protein
MALLNRVGFFLYNVCLFLTIGLLFLTLKHYNISNPSGTPEVSSNLEFAVTALVGAYVLFALLLTVSSVIQKARKKGFPYSISLAAFWTFVLVMVLFSVLSPILSDDITTPGWKLGVVTLGALFAFLPAMGVLLNQFPASIDQERVLDAIRKGLKKEDKENLPFCPECKAKVEPAFKYCPKCGVRFAD